MTDKVTLQLSNEEKSVVLMALMTRKVLLHESTLEFQMPPPAAVELRRRKNVTSKLITKMAVAFAFGLETAK